MRGINFYFLAAIAGSLFTIGIIILMIMKFLKKDNALVNINKLLKEGYYKKALNISLKYVNGNPNDYLVKYYIGQAYEGLKEYKPAIQYYEKASIAASLSAVDGIKVQIFLKIADLYRKTKKNNEALGYYVLALDKDSRNIKALMSAAELLYDVKNYKKAKEYLETLIRNKADNLRARFILAKVYVFLHSLSEASEQLEYILQNVKVKDDVLIMNTNLLLADVYLGMKNYSKALSILGPLLDNEENFETILYKVIEIYIKQGLLKEALDLAQRNIGRVSKSKEAEILYLIATVYYKDGEIYKAAKAWESAYKINPSYKDLKSLVSQYSFLTKNPAMEPLFSKDESVFENFALKLLKMPHIKHTIKNNTYWIIESGDKNFVIYKRPFPITTSELMEVQKELKQNLKSNNILTLYSLYGIAGNNNDSNSLYSTDKINLISDMDFIEAVKESNSAG